MHPSKNDNHFTLGFFKKQIASTAATFKLLKGLECLTDWTHKLYIQEKEKTKEKDKNQKVKSMKHSVIKIPYPTLRDLEEKKKVKKK